MNPPVQALFGNRLKDLPKAEVHLHLEGCFEADVIAQWAKLEGLVLPRPQEDLFKFSGLADFLGFLDLACGLASTAERLVELSYGLSQRLADNGTGYADVIFNPTHWHAWHGRLGPMLDAIDAGFKAAEQDGLPSVGLCVSLLRTQSADAAIELVDTLVAMRHPRVVALSVDGNEATAGRTGPRFAPAFRWEFAPYRTWFWGCTQPLRRTPSSGCAPQGCASASTPTTRLCWVPAWSGNTACAVRLLRGLTTWSRPSRAPRLRPVLQRWVSKRTF